MALDHYSRGSQRAAEIVRGSIDRRIPLWHNLSIQAGMYKDSEQTLAAFIRLLDGVFDGGCRHLYYSVVAGCRHIGTHG